MTKEEFIEAVIEKAHDAWAYKEQGAKVDVTIMLGRKKPDGTEEEPFVNVLLRSRL